jgi:anti-sigma factor RsiW
MNASDSHPGGKRILAWLDGELPEGEADLVRRHCEECEPCRQEWEELTAVGEALAAAPASKPISPVWPEIRDRLSEPDRPILKPAFGAAAAAAVLAGVAIGVLVGSGESQAPVSEGSYLWSAVGSSMAEDGGGTLSGAYTKMTIEQEDKER